MSARRRRPCRRAAVLRDPGPVLAQWHEAVQLRAEWTGHALSTAPADRAAAEHAVTGLYALLGEPPPAFVWVPSPAAASVVVPPVDTGAASGPEPVENRLATLVFGLRERLARSARVEPVEFGWNRPPRVDPEAALREGVPLRSVLERVAAPALRRAVRESLVALIRAGTPNLPDFTWYGQHDADWVGFYDIHRRVLGTRFGVADTAHFELWASLARSTGWWWPRAGVCVLADRPAATHAEPVPDGSGERRPHGPAVRWRDGATAYAWHGLPVPSWVFEDLTVARIAGERNVEIRRCAIERLGWTAFIDQAGLRLVSRAADPGNPGAELQLYDLPYLHWGARTRLLLAVNGSVERDGTRRRYGLRVPPWFDHPVDAAGWSYGLTGAQYAQLQRRT